MYQNHLHQKNGFLQYCPTNGWCVKVAATPIPATTYEDGYKVDIHVVIAKIPRLAPMILNASMWHGMVTCVLAPLREKLVCRPISMPKPRPCVKTLRHNRPSNPNPLASIGVD
jgi:hypothetical protein